MASVKKLVLNTLECEELGGAIIAMKQQCIASSLQSQSEDVLIEALNDPEVPQPGTSPTNYPNLVLTRRSPHVHPSDPSMVIIDLEYESRKNAKFNQDDFQFRVTGGTALQQIQSKYDGYGNQILLQHEFPSDDTYHPGETLLNGGEINVLAPRTTLRFEGVLRTAYPHYISSTWGGYINSVYWAGGAPYTWMCTDVQFSLLDTSNDGVASSLDTFMPVWNFTFEFMYVPETHIPVALFIDPQRGESPQNLIANVGYKYIDWYASRDFNELLPV